MSKVLRVLGICLGVLALGLGASFVWASARASTLMSRHIETHRVEVVVPTPLSEAELAALRTERARDGAAADDSLAGVDLRALASQRAVARGKHLVEARYACQACHGDDLAGGVMLDDPAIGNLRGPNLTAGKGGVVARYTLADWDRTVRHGVKPDGTPTLMPSDDFAEMSDQELSDVIAYVRSVPPVDGTVPPPAMGPVGKVLLALGKFPLSADTLTRHHQVPHKLAPPAADESAVFGEHLAAICSGCHRKNFAGGPMEFGPPSWPAAANLTRDRTGLASWTYEDFEKALVEGVSKDGRPLRDPMTNVVPGTRAMTPTERRALWNYLQSVAPQPTNT